MGHSRASGSPTHACERTRFCTGPIIAVEPHTASPAGLSWDYLSTRLLSAGELQLRTEVQAPFAPDTESQTPEVPGLLR